MKPAATDSTLTVLGRVISIAYPAADVLLLALLPRPRPSARPSRIVDRLRVATPLAQTFSAGVALWHGDETSDQTVARADKVLYQAKQAGRNQVLPADPPMDRRRFDHDPARIARRTTADRPTA